MSVRRSIPETKEDVEAIGERYYKSLNSESDRGCVLVAAALIDESLETLLRSKFIQDGRAVKLCVKPMFENMGPLSSYWAKTQLLRALEMLEDWEYADLNRIRELRNHFAHTYDEASFGDPKASEISKQLETAKRRLRARPSLGSHAEKTPRELFAISASFLAGAIHGMAYRNREDRKGSGRGV